MSGSTPFATRSPTQSKQYPPYSPTHPNRPYYGHEPFQIPPQHLIQTPPPFPPASLVQSPHHHRPPTLASPLPAPNTLPPPSVGTGPQYPPLASSPSFPLQGTYSRHLASASNPSPNMPAQYDGTPTHAHPSGPSPSSLPSPMRDQHILPNGRSTEGAFQESRPHSKDKPDRASNPMSFASILGPSHHEPTSKVADGKPSRPATPPPAKSVLESKPVPEEPLVAKLPDLGQPRHVLNGEAKLQSRADSLHFQRKIVAPSKPRTILTEREAEKILKALSSIEEGPLSDVEDGGLLEQKGRYKQRSRKRAADVAESELHKRKRRRQFIIDSLIAPFESQAQSAAERFRERYEPIAAKEIADKDIRTEKERKKDMQRKRRREQLLRTETQKMEEFEQLARAAEDQEEAQKYLKQAEKSQARIRQTAELLEGGSAQEDMEVAAPAPNYEGGVTSSFQIGSPEPPEPPKKRTKREGAASTRPKKSKEKKQAEKDAAEAAYAAMERDALVQIAPKEETKKETTAKGKKAQAKAEAAAAAAAAASAAAAAGADAGETPDAAAPTTAGHTINYESKGYNQIYEQIWRDMARKDIAKVYRIKQVSLNTRQENLRKTAILASKQARKWQERTNKSMKDTQARAKRVMREMMSFWKRNEREERDLRRMAERKEIEDAKKAEADREANRQKRKLNFLISQTEIYSHFIGRKIKTDEIERATNDPEVAAAAEKERPAGDSAQAKGMDDMSLSDEHGNHKVTNFEDLDFDAEDESELRKAAMANAASALQDAQDKARNFNGDDPMSAFDSSEMNFQNPTMAGDVQVSQPRMLQAQLKEYQLKGLNWLVNLYEQGINGILADEMGLGKTVQSISVMGYLAEQHNIWGPFLVIAPASTLHNWQQEITKFVPAIKVLPYWGNAKDRKILRKFWDRKHITYNKDSEFHVLVTSYQLVVQDAQYFQKIRWQYMILDEAQAIKSSSSSRWKTLLAFQCRNRLLLTGTPIQNNMQELWALLHFIMPTLFDSHDEFSDWFSKDIESHAQSNTKLNQDQLKRLHMILKPFMLRRVKAHVQKELGDKVEKDVFCDLTYRQRAYYANLRSKISIMDLIEKATLGDDQDTATLMNLVMQFRKVCNHPDLFERADTTSPFSMSTFAETASFLREGYFVQVGYSVRNPIQYDLPRVLCNDVGRLDIAGPNNPKAGFRRAGFKKDKLSGLMRIWTQEHIKSSAENHGAFSFLRFVDTSVQEASSIGSSGLFERAIKLRKQHRRILPIEDDSEPEAPAHAMFNIVDNSPRKALAELDPNSNLAKLCNISKEGLSSQGYSILEPAARPKASAPPIEVSCFDQSSLTERQLTMFNMDVRSCLFPLEESMEVKLLQQDVDPENFPLSDMLPKPENQKARYTHISIPSMRRFVTDSGKLAKLDQLLRELKNGGHRVLLYFQMTRMIDLMEEYLTYRNYKYCRLDGSTKLEDRRDTVHDFQTRPEIFIFLLSTRAGGLGINLTSADTVIFYDSDWNPTIDSQAMDRAHRLGQTKQVTVYRLITRGTIEERIRKRAMQKEEVQRVVITGGDGAGVDFNTRDRRENRTKDIAMWLADDDQAALIEQKEKEIADKPEEETKKKSKKALAAAARKKKGEMSLDDMYHEGEGHFEDASAKPSGAATPVSTVETPGPKRGPRGGKGISKKAKTAKQRLAIVDAEGDLGMGGM
ncbi:putative DNA helicase ino80 [Exophiala dermatitidis]|uniref:Chromatin-remodeling ATPase INO80 n=1 Tax=Exophiala dermatitidis (strain ATCC 34100 / CBS 525.76 / NIH/UT8656) TaxID=858893 RepID=H6BZZ1_EXODN|nr:adenosinetriphosphatase [Exophiala dermatitidis NIH/UT8656]KAJ4503549.1 putative DNA helicase ino80 [Exophiala dermatitidis]EHY57140.1 adenosinetriphosphatase [Exophiala dermatitidis NIH/UT8656]KAJ4514549.1 putative DNA helicase ino80 [Exophiala dermatitidis]KAJ4531837.1 putative DNA helicase ino80 [Exophiala dermatitidis]KAJ4537402.1 putative DNA helicase ino80 [Exophiala dermatitidis]